MKQEYDHNEPPRLWLQNFNYYYETPTHALNLDLCIMFPICFFVSQRLSLRVNHIFTGPPRLSPYLSFDYTKTSPHRQ